MRELKRELGPTNLSIRLWTLRDKDSMFRAKRDDVYILEVNARSEGDDTHHGHNVGLLTREFSDYSKAKEYYEMYLRAFGQSMQVVKRKQSR